MDVIDSRQVLHVGYGATLEEFGHGCTKCGTPMRKSTTRSSLTISSGIWHRSHRTRIRQPWHSGRPGLV